MYLVAIGWMFVVVLMAAAEATSPQGTVLGACFTFLLYGALPLSIVLYVMGAPGRRRARRAAELAELSATPATPEGEPATEPASEVSAHQPDGSGHAPGDAIAPERKET